MKLDLIDSVRARLAYWFCVGDVAYRAVPHVLGIFRGPCGARTEDAVVVARAA